MIAGVTNGSETSLLNCQNTNNKPVTQIVSTAKRQKGWRAAGIPRNSILRSDCILEVRRGMGATSGPLLERFGLAFSLRCTASGAGVFGFDMGTSFFDIFSRPTGGVRAFYRAVTA